MLAELGFSLPGARPGRAGEEEGLEWSWRSGGIRGLGWHLEDLPCSGPGSSPSEPKAEPVLECGLSHSTDPVDNCPPTILDSQSFSEQMVMSMSLNLKRNPYLWTKGNYAELFRIFLRAKVTVESCNVYKCVPNELDLVGGKKRNNIFLTTIFGNLLCKTILSTPGWNCKQFLYCFKHCQSLKSSVE